jgi:hypothetical protein
MDRHGHGQGGHKHQTKAKHTEQWTFHGILLDSTDPSAGFQLIGAM